MNTTVRRHKQTTPTNKSTPSKPGSSKPARRVPQGLVVAVAVFFLGSALVTMLSRKAGASKQLPNISLSAPATVPNSDLHSLRHYNIVSAVPIWEWQPTKRFAEELIKHNRPVVLRGSFVAQWPAMKKWTPEYIVKQTKDKAYDFKTAKGESVFIYSQEKALADLPELHFHHPWNVTYLTFRRFLELNNATTSDSEKEYHYFTGCLARSEDSLSEFPPLSKDTSPIDHFVANKDFYAVNLWIGSQGVVAQTHYDEAPNFATQIFGHKRWILSPPSEAPKLYGYPWLHPFRSQSQVDFKTGKSINYRATSAPISGEAHADNSEFPQFEKITAYEALQQPGDLLFIPPFWYHRVVTEDVSAAINAWTDPPGGDPHEQIIRLPLPIEDSWPFARKSLAMHLYFAEIAANLPPLDSFGQLPISTIDWTFRLLGQQYEALFREIRVETAAEGSVECFTPADPEHAQFAAQFKANLTLNYVPRVVEVIRQVADLHAQRLLFGNYIEKATNHVLGTAAVYRFIQQCLASTP